MHLFASWLIKPALAFELARSNQVMDVLGDGVLKFIACRVTVDGEIPDDSPVEAFHMSIMHASCGSCR